MLKVKLTEKAKGKLKEKSASSLRVELQKRVYEWTLCCGAGDSEVVVLNHGVRLGEGLTGDYSLRVEGFTIYLDKEIISEETPEKSSKELTIDVEGEKFVVKGLKPSSSCRLKPCF